jgi:hypothetical protein
VPSSLRGSPWPVTYNGSNELDCMERLRVRCVRQERDDIEGFNSGIQVLKDRIEMNTQMACIAPW